MWCAPHNGATGQSPGSALRRRFSAFERGRRSHEQRRRSRLGHLRATTLLVRRWGALADSQAPQKAGDSEEVGYADRGASPVTEPMTVSGFVPATVTAGRPCPCQLLLPLSLPLSLVRPRPLPFRPCRHGSLRVVRVGGWRGGGRGSMPTSCMRPFSPPRPECQPEAAVDRSRSGKSSLSPGPDARQRGRSAAVGPVRHPSRPLRLCAFALKNRRWVPCQAASSSTTSSSGNGSTTPFISGIVVPSSTRPPRCSARKCSMAR